MKISNREVVKIFLHFQKWVVAAGVFIGILFFAFSPIVGFLAIILGILPLALVVRFRNLSKGQQYLLINSLHIAAFIYATTASLFLMSLTNIINPDKVIAVVVFHSTWVLFLILINCIFFFQSWFLNWVKRLRHND